MTAPFPPLVASWTGDPQVISDLARQTLQMKLSDPGLATVQRLCGSAIETVRDYLFWESIPEPGSVTVPDPVRDATVAVLVELYRRRELSFNVLGTADPDGVAYRISGDWLVSNLPNLHPFRRGWGLA